MYPIFLFVVTNAPIESIGCQNNYEVTGMPHTLQQTLVKLARTQPLDVNENCEATQLQVHLQQAEANFFFLIIGEPTTSSAFIIPIKTSSTA